ncbi:MAG: glycosyltransferase family 9 protein, partial [Desulfobulbaceae bacterium]|nr:glycosyltransferase family 9 protein [Desulfobulbaceae bacterium]
MKASLKEFHPKKILVRSTNWIGDAIMTTPAVRTIRQNFPEAEISMLAQPWMADVFAASPHVDKIIFYQKKGEHRGLSGMLRLSRLLKTMHFDMAIMLQNAFEAALLAKMAGIPVRAGYQRDARSLLLTHGMPIRE